MGERQAGPTYVLEAVGGTRFPLPANIESPSDMTGIEPLQQAWAVVRNGGYVRTCSIGHPMGANVVFPGGQWANAGKTHVPGNYAGVQALRDLPRFVRPDRTGTLRRQVPGWSGAQRRPDEGSGADRRRILVRDYVRDSVFVAQTGKRWP